MENNLMTETTPQAAGIVNSGPGSLIFNIGRDPYSKKQATTQQNISTKSKRKRGRMKQRSEGKEQIKKQARDRQQEEREQKDSNPHAKRRRIKDAFKRMFLEDGADDAKIKEILQNQACVKESLGVLIRYCAQKQNPNEVPFFRKIFGEAQLFRRFLNTVLKSRDMVKKLIRISQLNSQVFTDGIFRRTFIEPKVGQRWIRQVFNKPPMGPNFTELMASVDRKGAVLEFTLDEKLLTEDFVQAHRSANEFQLLDVTGVLVYHPSTKVAEFARRILASDIIDGATLTQSLATATCDTAGSRISILTYLGWVFPDKADRIIENNPITDHISDIIKLGKIYRQSPEKIQIPVIRLIMCYLENKNKHSNLALQGVTRLVNDPTTFQSLIDTGNLSTNRNFGRHDKLPKTSNGNNATPTEIIGAFIHQCHQSKLITNPEVEEKYAQILGKPNDCPSDQPVKRRRKNNKQ